MQLLPAKELRPFIKHYLFIEHTGTAAIPVRMFSDANTGIVFSFSKLQLKHENRQEELPKAFAYGQLSSYKDLGCTQGCILIIAVFRPYGIHGLLGIAGSELQNKIIGFDELMGKTGGLLYEQLLATEYIITRLELLNTFFSKILYKKPILNCGVVTAAMEYIDRHQGLVSVTQLSRYMGYHERHIERRFAEAAGLTPKRYASIVKLHAFIKDLRTQPDHEKITPAVFENGYYDQSHAIRDFKKFTGLTPRQYLHQSQPLAINFLAV